MVTLTIRRILAAITGDECAGGAVPARAGGCGLLLVGRAQMPVLTSRPSALT